MSTKQSPIQLNLEVELETLMNAELPQVAPERVYLLLHGFNERAKHALKRFESFLPQDAIIIAPNAPYPLPEKRENFWRIGYAWYFYDSFKSQYLITPNAPAKMLAQLVERLAPTSKVTVVGFSQGGFLAPYLPHYCQQCDQVIMVNAMVRSDMVGPKADVEYHALNANQDPAVDFQKAKEHFDIFSSTSRNCFFHEIATDSHEIVSSHQQLLIQITSKA